MEWKDVIAYIVTPLFTLILVIFNLYLNSRLSRFVTKSEVQTMLDDECENALSKMDKKLEGHCPYTPVIDDTKAKLKEFDVWIKSHEKFAAESNEANHLLLQELVMNTQNICEEIGIKYFPKRNGK